MRVNMNDSDTMSPTQAVEPIIVTDNLQVEDHTGPPPEPSPNSIDINPVVEDNDDPGKISKIPDLIDEYFDSYSVGRDVPPIFLEKDLELSDLGISDEESAGWQKISLDSAIESRIHCSDCVEFMRKNMNDAVVDLTVTSPPYNSLRTYRGYEFNFEATARELFRVTKPGGVVVWVVGDAVVNGGETGTSFRQALYFQKIGFRLFDTMIYQKTGVSYPSLGRYTQIFEQGYALDSTAHNM